MMVGGTNAVDRALEAARELRAAAEETRRTIQASRDLVQRSRDQTLALTTLPETEMTPFAQDNEPSNDLVRSLIRAYELAEDDGDPRTRTLLGGVLHHVGCRIAAVVGPKAAHMAMH